MLPNPHCLMGLVWRYRARVIPIQGIFRRYAHLTGGPQGACSVLLYLTLAPVLIPLTCTSILARTPYRMGGAWGTQPGGGGGRDACLLACGATCLAAVPVACCSLACCVVSQLETLLSGATCCRCYCACLVALARPHSMGCHHYLTNA